MTYATTDEMTKRFGDEIAQLLDRDNDTVEDTGIFDAAAEDADALIDGYLATVYTLPFVTPPKLVLELAYDITRYELWGTRAPEEVRKRYEDAIARLKDIVAGLITLTDAGAVVETAGLSVAYTTRTRTFDDDTLCSFVGS